MFVLFTDFGIESPYVGQLKSVLLQACPAVPVLDLFHHVPVFDIASSAFLLAAYSRDFPSGGIFVCVVDPGVGSERNAIVLKADDHWYVGPDNGIFSVVAARARNVQWYEITWRPEQMSHTFHGRDLFAPVAAMIEKEELQALCKITDAEVFDADFPEEYDRVVYVDHYGNLLTGRRATSVQDTAKVKLAGKVCARARTFSDVAIGQAFWYENANGLIEIAVNQGSASVKLGAEVGTGIEVVF